MAAQTVQSWQIPKPLGTRASPAPGNTCGSPSLVVQDKPDAKCRYGWLVIKKTKKSHSHFLRSAPVPLGRCGSRVNGSIHDLWLHARWEQRAENPQGSAACGRCLSSDPILSPAGGWYTGPTYRHQNVLFTNCLEIIDKILGMCNEACETQAGVACTFLNNV